MTGDIDAEARVPLPASCTSAAMVLAKRLLDSVVNVDMDEASMFDFSAMGFGGWLVAVCCFGDDAMRL